MTVGDFIDALGGTTAVAEMAGVGKSAVSNWRKFNRFPPRLYLRLAAAARDQNIEIPEQLFEERRATPGARHVIRGLSALPGAA